jgi:uncharacterized low-complexity protein
MQRAGARLLAVMAAGGAVWLWSSFATGNVTTGLDEFRVTGALLLGIAAVTLWRG